jgi:hypothetical protein
MNLTDWILRVAAVLVFVATMAAVVAGIKLGVFH